MFGKYIKRYLRDDSGNTLIEYATIIALVSVTLVALFISLGASLSNVIAFVGDSVSSAAGAGDKGDKCGAAGWNKKGTKCNKTGAWLIFDDYVDGGVGNGPIYVATDYTGPKDA